MKKYIDFFLNYLQTEKDAAKSTIHKYKEFPKNYIYNFSLFV